MMLDVFEVPVVCGLQGTMTRAWLCARPLAWDGGGGVLLCHHTLSKEKRPGESELQAAVSVSGCRLIKD